MPRSRSFHRRYRDHARKDTSPATAIATHTIVTWRPVNLEGTLRGVQTRSCGPGGLVWAGSARLLDSDPCIQLGEIDADAALTGTWTDVDRGSVLRLAQASLQLRLRLMTDRALVRRRRVFVGDPHCEPSSHRFEPRLERRHLRPATLMRLAAGAGREAQERIFIIQDVSAF
jgi:hypothetical protein